MIPPWNTKRRIRAGVKEFRFTVVTTGTPETFVLPLELAGTYDFHVDWGDGSDSDITVWNHADTTHSYAAPDTHEIAITGTITGWKFADGGDGAKVYEIKSWGPLQFVGGSGQSFFGCLNMTITATDILDISGDTRFGNGPFAKCAVLTTIPSINSWDWSVVVDASYCFWSANLFNQDISGMIMPSCTNYNAFLSGCVNFNQNLGCLNIASATNMTGFLQDVTLTVANYDALILGFSPQAQTIVANFHGGNSKYTTGGAVKTARDAWVTKGWTITDGGENVGSELITVAADRDMSAGQSNWVVVGGVGVTWDNVDMDWNCAALNYVRLPVAHTEGDLYRIEFEITAFTSGTLGVWLGALGDPGSNTISTAGVYVFYMTANANNYITFGTAAFVGSLDNVSIKKCL